MKARLCVLVCFLLLVPSVLAAVNVCQCQVENAGGLVYSAVRTSCNYLFGDGCKCEFQTFSGGPWGKSYCWTGSSWQPASSTDPDLIPDCEGEGYSVYVTDYGSWYLYIARCNPVPACRDGIDNDGDGCTDTRDDGCVNVDDESEAPGVCCEAVGGGLLGGGCTSAVCPAEGDDLTLQTGCWSKYYAGSPLGTYPNCCCKAGYKFNPTLKKCVERHARCYAASCFDDTSNPLECLSYDRGRACCSGSALGYDYNYWAPITIY